MLQNIQKDTFYTLLVKLPVAMGTFLYSIFLTRLLGPTGNGVYSYFTIFVYLVVMLLSFNHSNSATYFTASKRIPFLRLLTLLFSIFGIGIIIFIAILMVLYLGPKTWANYWLPSERVQLIYFLFLFVFFISEYFKRLAIGLLRGLTAFKAYNAGTLIQTLVFLLAFGGLYFYEKNRYGYEFSETDLFSALIGLHLVSTIVYTILLWKNISQIKEHQNNLSSDSIEINYTSKYFKYANEGFWQKTGNFLFRNSPVKN